ncbi:MAG TPA: patatin-like phospholipase family protein [Pseudonocardia sp.]|jgi:NTE family protein
MSTEPPAGRPTVGLVLGGGAALGAAHAGVIEVLEDAGVSCSVVVGTSIGALIGAGYAAGIRSSTMIEMVLAATWSDFAEVSLSRRWGLLDTAPLEQAIERHLPVDTIEQLDRRFGAVAWDLRARETVLLTEGPLSSALRATTAVPGLFPPVPIGDRLLVDGALADNLPVWAARMLGADTVLAVALNEDLNTVVRKAGRLLETLHNPYGATSVTHDDRPPEVLIQPDTDGVNRWSQKGVPDLVDAGRLAARAALPAITRSIGHGEGAGTEPHPT